MTACVSHRPVPLPTQGNFEMSKAQTRSIVALVTRADPTEVGVLSAAKWLGTSQGLLCVRAYVPFSPLLLQALRMLKEMNDTPKTFDDLAAYMRVYTQQGSAEDALEVGVWGGRRRGSESRWLVSRSSDGFPLVFLQMANRLVSIKASPKRITPLLITLARVCSQNNEPAKVCRLQRRLLRCGVCV